MTPTFTVTNDDLMRELIADIKTLRKERDELYKLRLEGYTDLTGAATFLGIHRNTLADTYIEKKGLFRYRMIDGNTFSNTSTWSKISRSYRPGVLQRQPHEPRRTSSNGVDKRRNRRRAASAPEE